MSMVTPYYAQVQAQILNAGNRFRFQVLLIPGGQGYCVTKVKTSFFAGDSLLLYDALLQSDISFLVFIQQVLITSFHTADKFGRTYPLLLKEAAHYLPGYNRTGVSSGTRHRGCSSFLIISIQQAVGIAKSFPLLQSLDNNLHCSEISLAFFQPPLIKEQF